MSQDRAINYLQDKSTAAYNDLLDQWDALNEENAKKMDQASIGRGIGAAIGLGIGAGFGLPLWQTMLLTGGLSYAGSEMGETDFFRREGVQGSEAIESVGLRRDKTREIRGMADDAYSGFGEAQAFSALTDMGSAAFAGMGGMDTKGLNLWEILGSDTNIDFASLAPNLYSKHNS